MKSIWQKTVTMPSFQPLNQDLEVDIAIIGGGLAGILCAYLLNERGLQTAIFEANQIASGQIAGTTAKITAQHGPIYAKIIQDYGYFKAKQYYDAQMLALNTYREIIEKEAIDCDLDTVKTYLFTNEHPEILEQEANAYRHLHISGNLTKETELPFPILQALSMDDQALFHPLKFLSHLSKKLTIYEHTPIIQVKDHTLITADNKQIKARKIIFACHYPFINFPGYYLLKLYQDRSHVASYPCHVPIKNAYLSIDDDSLSLRPYQDHVLIGGYPHRTGQSRANDPFRQISLWARQLFKEKTEPDAKWASQDCMSLDGLPYIGLYAQKTPDWYVITGFQKWGMTNAMAGAIIIRDLIVFQKSEYADVFNPARFEPDVMVRPFLNHSSVILKNYLRHLKLSFKREQDLSPNEAGIVLKQFRKFGVYKDEHGNLHYCLLTCPHFGCELAWNALEKTWDCPCHGSRFDIDGNLLTNPALHPSKKV